MYTFKIKFASKKDKWIFIGCDEVNSMYQYEPFVSLVKVIAQKWNDGEWQGKISSVGEMRYKIKNDPLKLVYQWDSLFGIVFDYRVKTNLDNIKSFLADNYNIH